MISSRDHTTTDAARSSALPPTPPLLCDCCEWPMGAHEIVRLPDGAIPGLLVCSECVSDNLATQALEAKTL